MNSSVNLFEGKDSSKSRNLNRSRADANLPAVWSRHYRIRLLARLPRFRIEAVRHAPPANRGLALGMANPALGLLASGAGPGAVYLASTTAVVCAAAIALLLLNARSPETATRS